jgi:hypothetical protein
MSPEAWEEAFVGMSALLGEPLDQCLVALNDRTSLQQAPLVQALRSASREVRARAIAVAVLGAAAGIDELALR